MPAPTLLTDRLRLDAHRADDLEPLAAMWRQPEVYAMIGLDRPRPRGEVWKALTGAAGQWELAGFGGWTVRDRATGAVLGSMGLMEAMRDLDPPLDAPEAAWALAREAHGQGLAREALAAILGWADARGIARTQCIVDPSNARSIALAAHLGYAPLGPRRIGGEPILVLERHAGGARAG